MGSLSPSVSLIILQSPSWVKGNGNWGRPEKAQAISQNDLMLTQEAAVYLTEIQDVTSTNPYFNIKLMTLKYWAGLNAVHWFSILDLLLTLTPHLSSLQMQPVLKFWYFFHYPSVWSGHSRWLFSCSLYILCSTSPCFTNMHPHDYLILLIIKLNRSRACLRLPPAPLMVSPITDEPTWCPFPLPSSTPRSKNCCHPCLLSAICSVVSLQDSASSCKIFSLINCWWLLLSRGSCFSLTVGQLHIFFSFHIFWHNLPQRSWHPI